MSQKRSSEVKLEDFISLRAQELGFHALGLTKAQSLPAESDRLAQWLSQGNHAGMSYLERWSDVRGDPGHPGMVEGARTVVSLAMAYPGATAARGLTPLLARYARGPDYHTLIRDRLKQLLRAIRGEAPHVRGRALVDTAPLFERAWAQRAGLGWIGRNSCLIHPELGSWIVLGELVLTVDLEHTAGIKTVDDRCGSCRACVQACPTGALQKPDGRVLDARRCLSYWTVEAAGEIPADLGAPQVLFGCDACQRACPFNQGLDKQRSPLEPLNRWQSLSLEKLVEMDLRDLRTLIRGTALERAGERPLKERARKILAQGSSG